MVLMSLSGWSLDHKVLHWYNPDDPELWISNAFSSLQSIASEYHLDSIDMDYNNFPKINDPFSYCIDELITHLKNESVITVATIASYYKTVEPYLKLFAGYVGIIVYVNHQFYTDKVRTPKGYLEALRIRAQQFFEPHKVLPSYEIDGRGIQGDAFFEALKLLEENEFEVNGMMIWSADGSSSHNFYYERKSQDLLLNSTNY